MKNKKIKILVVMPILVFIIGFTLAYYYTTNLLNNDFESTFYGSSLIKDCDAPESWWPGESYTCEISGKNKSDIDVALRIIVVSQWYDEYGNQLDNSFTYEKYDEDTESYIDVTEDYAQINFVNEDDWINGGNIIVDSNEGQVYYFKNKLSKNESTSLLINQISYNIKSMRESCLGMVTNDSKKYLINAKKYAAVMKPEDEDKPEIKEQVELSKKWCVDNDKYYGNFDLKFYIETVQYDVYKDVWNTDVEID